MPLARASSAAGFRLELLWDFKVELLMALPRFGGLYGPEDKTLRRGPIRHGGGLFGAASAGYFAAKLDRQICCRHPRKRVIQYSRAPVMAPRRRDVLDTRLFAGMTASFVDAGAPPHRP